MRFLYKFELKNLIGLDSQNRFNPTGAMAEFNENVFGKASPMKLNKNTGETEVFGGKGNGGYNVGKDTWMVPAAITAAVYGIPAIAGALGGGTAAAGGTAGTTAATTGTTAATTGTTAATGTAGAAGTAEAAGSVAGGSSFSDILGQVASPDIFNGIASGLTGDRDVANAYADQSQMNTNKYEDDYKKAIQRQNAKLTDYRTNKYMGINNGTY